MSIDNRTVRKVSKLAKIKINEKEETKLIEELNNILETNNVKKLSDIIGKI